MTSSAGALRTAGEWRAALSSPHTALALGFPEIYGSDETLWFQRLRGLARAAERYVEQFGDGPVRVFRAPGRINLRGMHVDTHGGYLNLMTHQREVLVVSGPGRGGETRVANTNSDFPSLTIGRNTLPDPVGSPTWADYLDRMDVQAHVAAHAGSWRNYIEGAWLRAGFGEAAGLPGLNIVVDSDLPRGAALSSSAALCLALLEAWTGWNGLSRDGEARILAAQDAEWFTGSRCGTCDQAAIVLGERGKVIHGALDPREFTVAGMRAIALPEDLSVLVINSFTRRSISGAEKVAYTRNRFAYSMALEIFQQTLRDSGRDVGEARRFDRLSRITTEALGGDAGLLAVLKRIPESMTLNELQGHYVLPDLDHEYTRYFGDVDVALRPSEFGLRGPLLYGIAESERARHFAQRLEQGNLAGLGRLMTDGHAGDRRVRNGAPVIHRVDDGYLDGLIASGVPVVECPGAYGASSPALDSLVDCALEAGALGASLTGAGIAGVVLALCRRDQLETLSAAVQKYMADPDYHRIANLGAPLSEEELSQAVVENHAVAGVGELTLGT